MRYRHAHGIPRLHRALAHAGWKLEILDMDFTIENPLAELKVSRTDGQVLWARVDALGRCVSETYQREVHKVARYPLSARSPTTLQVRDALLSRTPHQGPRAMLRHVTRYVANHPLPAADIDVIPIRAALADIMAAPARVIWPHYTPRGPSSTR